VKRHADEVPVDEELVRRLLRAQFPQWADLPLTVVAEQGTDHTLFRLGGDMVVRMPIMEYATRQAKKEARWLPFLASQVPLQMPTPIAIGEPGEGYPFSWSIVSWIDGEKATPHNVDLDKAAVDLARFIKALHACDPTDGPKAGPGTGYRGVSLKLWVERVDQWIAKLDGRFSRQIALWREIVQAPEWDRAPVWFHGDLSWNLIAKEGRLVGVIDSGYGVGDPACDLMPAWTLFRGASRQLFLDEVGLDDATITRSKGFALAPAFIGVTYYKDVPHLQANAITCLEAFAD
jgi:aminoglycoside phosphotransferase (APT) family kinase protein